MLQRLAYSSNARRLCAAWLALAVVAAPAAFAQQDAPGAEVAQEDAPQADVAQQAAPEGEAAQQKEKAPEAEAAPREAPEPEAPAEGSAPAAPPTGIEVIRVKGRSENEIQTEVPASVTQFDADTLLALGAQNVSELAKITPNLEIRTAGATAPTFFIRGVGLSDFNANAGGSVAVYQDGVALNSPALQLGQLFDVESVEVLRGPQGGGSGRNASAGAIKISSRKPVGDLSAYLNSSYGNYDYRDFDGAVEFPIVEENLSSRLAFRLTQRDGWGTNNCGGLAPPGERPPVPTPPGYCSEVLNKVLASTIPVPGGLATDVNDLGNWAARGILRYQPEGSDMDWLLIGHGGRTDQLSTLGQAVGTRGGYGPGAVGEPAVYKNPDAVEEYNALVNDCTAAGGTDCVSQATAQTGKNVAKRLDIRPRRGDYDRTGDTKLDTWGGSLTGSVPLGPFRLTSISAYDGYDRFRDEDLDFTSRVIFESVTNDDAWQASQELRLDGELEDYPLRWQAGGYYLMEKLSSSTVFIQPNEICPVNFTFPDTCPLPYIHREDMQSYTQDLYSFAFYAGFVWDFLDDFTLEGGVRYNWERKTFDYTLQQGINSPKQTPSNGSQDEQTWQSPTGTLSLTYRFREDLSAYWKYSHGWKGGQFNASALSVGVPPAEPESIDAWETGINGYWADGRVGLSAALFYYKYYGYQVFIVENNLGAFPQVQVINANEAQVYGAEVEAQLQPLAGLLPYGLDGLQITARFGWLESEFLDFTNEVVRQQLVELRPRPPPLPPQAITRTIPSTIDYSGNPLISSPQFKLGLSAEWSFDLGRFGSITPRYDGAWTSDISFDPANGRGAPDIEGNSKLPEYAIGQPAFFLHNLSLRYTLPIENIQITGWVRNLTDEAYKTYAFDVSEFARETINFVGEPRTFGGTVSIFW